MGSHHQRRNTGSKYKIDARGWYRSGTGRRRSAVRSWRIATGPLLSGPQVHHSLLVSCAAVSLVITLSLIIDNPIFGANVDSMARITFLPWFRRFIIMEDHFWEGPRFFKSDSFVCTPCLSFGRNGFTMDGQRMLYIRCFVHCDQNDNRNKFNLSSYGFRVGVITLR